MIEPIPTWRCGRCGCKVQAKLPPLGELHRKEVGGPLVGTDCFDLNLICLGDEWFKE